MRDKMCRHYMNNCKKRVRALNKNIYNDDLWLGRFHMNIVNYGWYRFEDNSGGILRVYLRCIDKKDKLYRDYYIEYAPYLHNEWKLWLNMNKFITEDTNVWANGRPVAEDFRNVKVPNLPFHKDNTAFWCTKSYE